MNISLGGDETLHVELEANSVDRWPNKELRSLSRSDMVKRPPIPPTKKIGKQSHSNRHSVSTCVDRSAAVC